MPWKTRLLCLDETCGRNETLQEEIGQGEMEYRHTEI